MEKIKRFFKDETGTQTVETALVLGLISIAAIALMGPIGTAVTAVYQAISDAAADAQTAAS